ncbi:FecR family protein [Jiella pacifica]|uniref:Iron dicitrate transport regulator FecR n=1 Tax=Jiella pacifica TaxID=2696469 RepID=A0A6N9TD75_9HYPH|nr:FecR domain-containing protein [Jiella pacifica]NDW07619.1 iron dicitrate transport regulator FecR [Jiella pacifica]
MTEKPSNDDRLFEEAFDLVIRLQSDPANPVAGDLVKRWRARGPEYEAAWAEAAEIHGMAGKVLEDRRGAGPKEGISRRGFVLGGAGIAAALGAGALFGPGLVLRARADHITSTGEIRDIALSDGTKISLGPDSAMRSEISPAMRRVELLAGMAFFDVAASPDRPFQAVAGNLTATALRTAFDVSRDADRLALSVQRGSVEARMPDSPLAFGERLSAGDWLSLDGPGGALERGRRDPSQIASWREGVIVAERETVASLVARIARWQPGRVLIADPALGARQTSGVFDLANPIAAFEAVVQPHGGKVRQISRWLTVISPI